MALQMVTVTGLLKHLDGTPQIGRVEFALPYTLVDPAGHVLWSDRAVVAELDETGSFTASLPATDSAGVSPTNWTYAITIAADGNSDAPFQCLLPSSPSAVHLDELVRVDVPPTVGVWVPVSALGTTVAQLGTDGKVLPGQLPAGSGGNAVASVTAANGTIAVTGTATNPLISIGTGIPESAIAGLTTDLSTLSTGVGSASSAASAAQSTATAAGSAAAAAQSTANSAASTAAAAYVKPGPGIPKADLAGAVQTSLGLADTALQTAPVISVATRTGAVTLTKADVGLSSVDNTSDTGKPVSTAQGTAIGLKYTLPGTGVPKTDLATAVQTSLGLADTALQLAPVDPAAWAYLCHTSNYDPFMAQSTSTINEQWFMRILVRAWRQINLVKTFVRTAGTAGAGGLNGFSIYDDTFSSLLWNSVSDDAMWLAAGEVSKTVTGSMAGLTNRTPTVDTWFRVGISARGHTAAPNFPFANFGGTSALTDAGGYRCRYRASAYSSWPASLAPASDLAGVTGFVPPVLIG